MNLIPLVQKLEDDGLGIMGQSIFINMLPVECQRGILLRNKLAGTTINYELPGYYRSAFQVIIRAQGFTDGEALIQSVFDSLTLAEESLGSVNFKYMRPKTKPSVFPLSKGNLFEFSSDFDVAYTE